jgi:hypothetical protein
VEAAFDHEFPVDSEEVKMTFSPSQNVKDPFEVIVGIAGIGLTVTVVGNEVAEHPFASVFIIKSIISLVF